MYRTKERLSAWVFRLRTCAQLAAPLVAGVYPTIGLGNLRVARAADARSPVPRSAAGSSAAPSSAVNATLEAVAPKPASEVTPEYPFEALEAGIETGTVLLALTINADGKVTAAEVLEDAGYGFGVAALRAASATRFFPARRGDTAVAARIRLRVDFRRPAAPTPVETPQGAIEEGPPLAPSPSVSATAQSAAAASTAEPNPTPTAAKEAAQNTTSVDVRVQRASAAERSRRSAEAVKVVELGVAKRGSADLGEILARQAPGLSVQREGGLGSRIRISLNGLTGDQVRMFVDGIPIELMGFPSGLGNVPVNLVDRIEIHSGVVPVRFGADALGGAINLVTAQDLSGTHATASYELGSFDTHQVSASAQHLSKPLGFFTRVNAFFDYARNNYPIDVNTTDERGRLTPTRIERFHDAYHASGANLELGFVKRSWAKRLLLRSFVTEDKKQYQHNIVMTVPYGGVTYGERGAGTMLRYEQPLADGVLLDAFAGYSYTQGEFVDVAPCVYDWFGNCGHVRRIKGETDTVPHDSIYWDKSGFARLSLSWTPHPQHRFSLAIAPTYLTRSADERLQSDPAARDPLNADRRLLTLVNGLEYKLQLFDEALENIAFVKQYVQQLKSEEPRPGNLLRRRDRGTHHLGVGNGLRYNIMDWLYAKASYEFATRLPRPDEIFGDNAFVVANLELDPERSHNANLGLNLDAKGTQLGAFRGMVSGFVRAASQQIVLLGNDKVQMYQNVYGARSTGIEGALGWTSIEDYVTLDGNVTYLDFRNTSAGGTFGDFKGDRIPNRPYLFANGSARFLLKNVLMANDELSLAWYSRYTHEYFRGWESIGLRSSKQVTPMQLVHSLGVGYFTHVESTALSLSVDVQNLTNEAAFDFFGVQRPGRAFYAKLTAEF